MKTGKNLQELAAEIMRRAAAKADYLTSTAAIVAEPAGQGVDLVVGDDLRLGINDVAHAQMAEHAGIPKAYYDKMLREDPSLLANNINVWFRKYPAERMLRTLDGRARAFLSDKFRPLENEELAQAVLPVIGDLGLDVMSCEITDKRLYIKAVDPKVTRELARHGAQFGDGGHTIVRVNSPAITISNSEVGWGALSVLGGLYDGFCSNLATFGERSMRKYHVGAKHDVLGDDVYALLSNDARQKTDAALWAQVRDVVKAAFDRARFDELCDKVEGARVDKIEKGADVTKVVKVAVRKLNLTEDEGKSVLQHLIEGADLSRFGLYNAVTRAAQDVESYDRASELERVGAKVIELPKNEWRELAMAA